MSTNPNDPSVPAATGLPQDLRRWLGEDRLLHLSLAAVAEGAGVGEREFRHGDQRFPFGQMLATMAFAYLSGRAGSDEIEDQLERDPALRYLCAGRFPVSTAFRRFRRVHRGALGAIILRILRQAVAERSTLGWLTGPIPGWLADDTEVVMRCAAAAEACLARAVFADTVAMDM